jgi:hypothetical protein
MKTKMAGPLRIEPDTQMSVPIALIRTPDVIEPDI